MPPHGISADPIGNASNEFRNRIPRSRISNRARIRGHAVAGAALGRRAAGTTRRTGLGRHVHRAPTRGDNGAMEPADMMAAVVTGLQERTGRTLAQWLDEVQEAGLDPLEQRSVRAWLRARGVPKNSQWAIADAAAREAGWVPPDVEASTATLYGGTKAHLRPLHDAIVEMTHALGPDVEAQPRGTYIPLVRRTQFLALAPGPRDTLRVGFRFRGEVPHDDRLRPAKSFAQATHWVHVDADWLDAELLTLEPLIATAYEQNG